MGQTQDFIYSETQMQKKCFPDAKSGLCLL